MDPVLISVGSLLVAIVLALVQVRKFFVERRDQLHNEAAGLVKAPAERQSIIIGGAETAVKVLETALNRAYADYEKQQLLNETLKAKVREYELRIEKLERTNRELEYRLSLVERDQREEDSS